MSYLPTNYKKRLFSSKKFLLQKTRSKLL